MLMDRSTKCHSYMDLRNFDWGLLQCMRVWCVAIVLSQLRSNGLIGTTVALLYLVIRRQEGRTSYPKKSFSHPK